MVLSPRLKAIINLISEDSVADIGTDHAILAIELAKAGKKVIATDISSACIEKANRNIEHVGVNVETRIGDGLYPIKEGEVDVAVISGMGAREIIKILSDNCKVNKYVLVPHQDTKILREYLFENGFFINSDTVVFSEGKYYSVISAEKGVSNYTKKELFLGKNNLNNPDFAVWSNDRLKRLKKIYLLQKEKTVLEEIFILEKTLNKLTVGTVEKIIEEIAPKSLAMEGDNVGLLLGDPEQTVNKILICLDVTPDTVSEAVSLGANLMISHHPIMFHPINNLVINTPENNAIHTAIKNGISIISAHTNFDFANGGLNDYLMLKLNIIDARVIKNNNVRIGNLSKPLSAAELCQNISEILSDKVRLIGENKKIKTVAVMCGGGGHDREAIDSAFLNGADCYISGDTRYDIARYISDQKKTMLVFGHYESEILFIELMENLLLKRDLGVTLIRAATNTNPYLN